MTQICRGLDFARPKPPTRDPVDVVQVVRQMIVLLAPEARKRTATLVLADELRRGMVLGDPSKLMQIFTNLTINATQAMPNGGTVTLAVERKRVQPPAVEQLPEADYICVDVRDTGTGIRHADLGHIFERSSRRRRPKARNWPGVSAHRARARWLDRRRHAGGRAARSR
jgi:signal transduction histidine kinase